MIKIGQIGMAYDHAEGKMSCVRNLPLMSVDELLSMPDIDGVMVETEELYLVHLGNYEHISSSRKMRMDGTVSRRQYVISWLPYGGFGLLMMGVPEKNASFCKSTNFDDVDALDTGFAVFEYKHEIATAEASSKDMSDGREYTN